MPRSLSTLRLPYARPRQLSPPVPITDPSPAGREREARRAPRQAGQLPRADDQPRGVRPQALQQAVHHLPRPEVLPHPREPQLRHRPQHRGQDHQRQHDSVRADCAHGRPAGLRRPLLLPGRPQGLRVMVTVGASAVYGGHTWPGDDAKMARRGLVHMAGSAVHGPQAGIH